MFSRRLFSVLCFCGNRFLQMELCTSEIAAAGCLLSLLVENYGTTSELRDQEFRCFRFYRLFWENRSLGKSWESGRVSDRVVFNFHFWLLSFDAGWKIKI